MKKRHRDYHGLKTALISFFEADLKSLPGFSRGVQDWVIENNLHPHNESIFFSLADAVDALKEEFDVYGSSPKISTD
jgi:hypothetical protein